MKKPDSINLLIKDLFTFINFLILFAFSIQTHAQADNDKMKAEQDFTSFKNKTAEDFTNFKAQNDSVFLTNLKNNWKEFVVFKEERIKRIKPKIQPVVTKGVDKIEFQKPDTVRSIEKIERPELFPGKEQPHKEAGKIVPGSITVNFFGETPQIIKPDELPILLKPGPENIIGFYMGYLQNQKLIKTALDLYATAKELGLNDWGYLILLKCASEKIFSKVNERVLYTWISLLKTGYNARIGYDEQNVCLLTATDGTLFNTPYITISGTNYYIIVFKDQKISDHGLKAYESRYPGRLQPLSLMMNVLPNFIEIPVSKKIYFEDDTLSVHLNQVLISYLNDYPGCELPVYFNAPLSEKIYSYLDLVLKPKLKGRSEVEKINILLEFIQKSFPYKTDNEQFGREKYMFGDEAVYYPFTDCDDRAVLMTKFVKRYTNLEVVGLDYPDHVSTAVRFNEPFQGDYIIYNGEKYFVCDPTYIGAHAGMAMDEMQKTVPGIIPVIN
jgi:hypothetical protein